MNQNFIKSKLIFLLCCLYFGLQAQTLKNTKITADSVTREYSFFYTKEKFPQNDYQEKRFALVVAVAQYSGGLSNLPNNINDANDMTKVLNQCGFDVMLVINPTKEELQNAIKHARKYYIENQYNITFVYFSGHGAQLNATNFIMPSDAFFTRVVENKNNLKQFFNKSLLLSDLTGVFDQPQTKYAITVLDACRSYDYILKQKNAEPLIDDINFINLLNQDNEKVEMKGKNALFLPIEAGEGTPAIGPNNRNSFFTYYLLKALEKRPLNVTDLQDKLVDEMKSINQSPIFKGGAYKYRFQFYAKGSSIIPDRDVNVHTEVEIGEQTWMAKNLNVDRFRNGDIIPEARTKEDWNKSLLDKKPVWCYYNFDSTLKHYGKIYNWYAVNDTRVLAPHGGWRIPTRDDWRKLFGNIESQYKNLSYIDSKADTQEMQTVRLTIVDSNYEKLDSLKREFGKKIRSNVGWANGGNGNDNYGLSVFPYGCKGQGDFFWVGDAVVYWSTTSLPNVAATKNDNGELPIVIRNFTVTSNNTSIMSSDESMGCYIRCLK
jgi:uncharacterized protein (TIGR02145 family)